MECIKGKQSYDVSAAMLHKRLAQYREVWIDLGTGDGRCIRHLAQEDRARFLIGVDACRENLRTVSRMQLENALFVIANAYALPVELCGLASHITINFPWGSLLTGLLSRDPALLHGMRMIARPDAHLEIRLNSGALLEAGSSLEQGAVQIRHALLASGWRTGTVTGLDAKALRAYPSTWAHRLAFGRDPRALLLRASLPQTASHTGVLANTSFDP